MLPGEHTDWKVLKVDEKHPCPCLVQLLQDVKEGGIGGVDIILDQRRLLLGQNDVTTDGVAFK